MDEITILIPVYNEAENIPLVLEKIEKVVSYPHVINIIYDFDQDTSIPAVEGEKTKYKTQINLVKNLYGSGVANAIKTGFKTAQSEFIIVTMADLCDSPSTINNMFEIAIKDNADIVCASRYMKGGRKTGGGFIKTFLSYCACLSLYYLARIPIHDATNSFKLYRKSFLDKITINSTKGFEISLELVVKAFLEGYKICEIPTIWTDRIAGQSNFKIIDWFFSYLKWYFLAFSKFKRVV